jgi:phage FluMu protein Com
MGCECSDEGGYRSSASSKEGFTAEVHCPKCRRLVYFVRHNGGSVWLDELGQPWPKHPCYDQQGSTEGLEEFFKSKRSKICSKIENLHELTDLGQRIAFVSTDDRVWEMYPAPDFWLMNPPPAKGERIEVNAINRNFKIRDQKFCYWPISLNRCGKCSKLYIRWEFHREICGTRGTL